MNIIEITPIQLFFCLGFIMITGISSLFFQLGIGKDLMLGTVRTFAQLFLVGYVLKYIFNINNPYLIIILYLWMIFWAAWTIKGRVGEKKVKIFPPTFISMAISYMIVTIIVTAVIIQVEPWYTPQYFIPLGGMIVGNSMNAICIALDRMFSDIKKGRDEIELALCLGATYQEATGEIMRNGIKAGMIPSINSLMTVGLVSLPGMMTGQILSGTDPVTAVKYQIIVMLMLVASTAIGCVIVIYIIRKMCFTRAHQIAI